MSTDLNVLVNEILQKWIAVAGIDMSVLSPDKRSWTCSWGGSLAGEANQRDHLRMLENTWDLDPTGVTTLMVVRGFFEEHLKGVKFDALDMILNRAKIASVLKPLEELRDLLEGELVQELVERFQQGLRSSARSYGADPTSSDFEQTLTDKLLLAELRKDAFRALDKLEVHQFTKGTSGEKPLRVNPQIFEFWNINSVLSALQGQLDQGVTLCLIRDPMVLHSFFVFAVKNGENLIILTDRAKVSHPDFKNMTRSRAAAREFEARASRFWLPYNLLDLKVSDDQKELYAKARTALVPNNAQGVRLAEVKDLHPTQFIWLMMVFDRINAQFFVAGRTVPELSYTGEMVADPHVLVGEHGSLVTKGHYSPLSLAPITSKMMAEIHESPQWERESTGWNRWMTRRYENQVPEEAFQIIGEAQIALTVSSLRGKGALSLDLRSDFDKRMSRKEEIHGFKALEPTSFGTAEDLDKDRKWAARVNQTRVIQDLADKEFAAKVKRVFAWYERMVKRDVTTEKIMESVARESLILPFFGRTSSSDENPFAPQGSFRWKSLISNENVLTCGQDQNLMYGHRFGLEEWLRGIRFSTYSIRNQGWDCTDRGTAASVFYKIRINCPEAVAALLDMQVSDLPWALQHTHFGDHPYYGNQILESLDPEDWILKNPWEEMCLDIHLPFSKNAIHARRKALGLPRREWPSPPSRD